MKIKTILRTCIVIGICASSYHYIMFATWGIKAYKKLQQEAVIEEKHVELLEQEINSLNATLETWNTQPITQERVAREDLQMSYTNELIYIIPNSQT